jgi:limonene-1,2-epoxide hydrolase
MSAHVQAASLEAVKRLHTAMNQHDLNAFLACFDPSYQSEQPAHPNRGFGGRAQVEKNWSALFEGIPDFHAELLATATEGDTLWCEWRWTGTRADDGPPLDLRGVTLFEIKASRIVSGRLYMEQVEVAGAHIDETVRRLAKGNRLQGE